MAGSGADAHQGGIIARLGGVPLELLLTTERGALRLVVDEEQGADVRSMSYRVDGGEWKALDRKGTTWRAQITTRELGEGAHTLEVSAAHGDGAEESIVGTFRVRSHPV